MNADKMIEQADLFPGTPERRSLALPEAGQMIQLIQGHPWESTPLGPVALWSSTLRSMVDLILNSPIPSAIYWGSEMIIIYNDPYRESLEHRHPHALGRPAALVWEPECWARFSSSMESVLADGKAVVEEKVCHTHLIDTVPVKSFWNYTASPIFDQGRIVGVFKTDQNITDQVNAFSALIESDERLALVLSGGTCVGTWDWDVKRDIVFAERRFALFYGLDPAAAAAGLPIADYFRNIHPDDRDRVQQAVDAAIHNGQEYGVEYRLVQHDGSARRVSAKGRCTYGDNGEPVRFPGAIFDLGPAPAAPKPLASEVRFVLPLGSSERKRSRTSPPPPPDRSSSPTLVALLVEFIARQLVVRKDAVRIRTHSDLLCTRILLGVAPEDASRVTGPDGRTAHSIQVVLDAASLKRNHTYLLEVEEIHTPLEPVSELLQ